MKASSALACAVVLAFGALATAAGSDGAAGGHADRAVAKAPTELASAAEPKLKWKPYRPQQAPSELAESKATAAAAEAAPAGKQASATKESAADKCDGPDKCGRLGKVDGKVEQCAATSKPTPAKSRLTRAKTEPTLAKVPRKLATAGKTRSKIVRTATALQDDDPLADPFDEATPRPGRQEVDQNLDEPTTTVPDDEVETPSMPEDTDSPELTPDLTPPTTRPPRTLEPEDELRNPDGTPTTEDISCEKDKKACQEDFQALKANVIGRIDLDISISGVEGKEFPCECSPSGLSTFEPRSWCQTVYTWKASGLCHKPLYFEDVHLERYGHSWNPVLQPFLSGAHFFVTVPLLPYKMGMNPPNECIYTLGYYRPGNCAPYLIDPIPLSLRGAIYQGAVVTGAVFIFP